MWIILHDNLFYLDLTHWQLRNSKQYVKFASVFYHISYHFTSGCSSSVETLLWNGRKAGTGPFSGSCGRKKYETNEQMNKQNKARKQLNISENNNNSPWVWFPAFEIFWSLSSCSLIWWHWWRPTWSASLLALSLLPCQRQAGPTKLLERDG